MSFSNTYQVDTIKNFHEVSCFCPLGRDNYTAHVEIEVMGPAILPDYLDTDKFIASLYGNELIIEDLAHKIALHFKQQTEADTVLVMASVSNAKHSPVEVTVRI